MKLAVNKFFNYRPASQWAFDVEFSDVCLLSNKVTNGRVYLPIATKTMTSEDLTRLNQSVVSITQPKFDIKADTKCYGNFDFVVPIYDANNITLTVTFEDTDDCLVSYKFLSALMGNVSASRSIPAWLNVHAGVFITIHEYDTYTADAPRMNFYEAQEQNYNTTSVKSYYCKMIEYTEPVYSRSSESPQAATMTITFLAVPSESYAGNNSKLNITDTETAKLDTEQLIKWAEQFEKLVGNIKTIGGNALGAVYGFMHKADLDIKKIYQDAIANGKVFKSYADVQRFVTENLATTFQGNCTRGIALTHALYEYIWSGDAAKGIEKRYFQYYPGEGGAGRASLYGTGKGNTSNASKLFTEQKVDGSMGRVELNKMMQAEMKPGDYITFNYTKWSEEEHKWVPSWHITQLSTDESGKLVWSSDTIQAGKPTNAGNFSGLPSSAKDIKDIKIYRFDGSKETAPPVQQQQ